MPSSPACLPARFRRTADSQPLQRQRNVPELPDITVYIEALRARVVGQPLERDPSGDAVPAAHVEPPLDEVVGKRVLGVERLGKRIVIALEDELFIVLHLMIAGRLHWKARDGEESGQEGARGVRVS